MRLFYRPYAGLLLLVALIVFVARPSLADGDLRNVQHIIVIMQENHSFDNYFGALAYAPGSPYHSPGRDGRESDDERGGCPHNDHACVDGLTCRVDAGGNFTCENSNRDDDGSRVAAFHDSRRCVGPDLDHEWANTHREMNFHHPNETLFESLSDGFVRVNDKSEQHDNGVESPTDDQTMSFYNQAEIPFYYDLARKFAINDRYFASVLGPTFPNRAYLLAATSFGHLTTSDSFPPPGSGGYKPITGTIFDLLDQHHVSWADYFFQHGAVIDVPQGGSYRPFPGDPHFRPLGLFLAQVAGAPGVPPLPAVSFIDPDFGVLGGRAVENDEHPPTDIQRGQAFVASVINAVRNSPFWRNSIIILTYDEHGGFYDHVAPPRARQGHAPNPDGINPGQCADLSNPPASLKPGGGAECSSNLLSATDNTVKDAEDLCPAFAADPTGPYPAECANFDQYGVRVPFLAVSAFSKPHYVSHTVGDHTSILALIEKRFMASGKDDEDAVRPHLTRRDLHASALEDMFDFDRVPSLNTAVGIALPPAQDCTPK